MLQFVTLTMILFPSLPADLYSSTLSTSREKAALQRTVESLRQDVSDLRSRLDDVRLSRQETLKQLMELRAQHENQLTSMQLDLRDETSSREVRAEDGTGGAVLW